MTKKRFTCPVCGGGSRWPTSVDLDHLEDNLRSYLEWDEPRIQKTILNLEDEGLIYRNARNNTKQPTEPWLDVCEPCAVGKQRCETCHAILSSWRNGEKTCGRCYRKSVGIRDRAPDSQRTKVYRMERRAFSRSYFVNASADEARALLKRLSRRFHVKVPGLNNLTGKGSNRRGDYSFGYIRAQGVSCDMVCTGTILHEFAHHLNHAYHPDEVAHGATFVRCLYEVMRHAGYADQRPNQGLWKVKIGNQSDFWDAVGRARSLRL